MLASFTGKFSKLAVFLYVVCFILIVMQAVGTATTIYVPDDYGSIQAAVDAASPGGTIIVRDGSYAENVDVDKDHLTIRSENGAVATIVQAAISNDHVFQVVADYVTIDGFTAQGAGGEYKAGIYLNDVSNCNLTHNHCVSNYCGIGLHKSRGNSIINNDCSNNEYGIAIEEEDDCAAERVIYQGGAPNPEGILNSLRTFRDKELIPEYTKLYYEYSPDVKLILIEEPSLLLKACLLIIKYIPAVRHLTGDKNGRDFKVSKRDVEQVLSFTERLRFAVDERRVGIGAERSAAMIELLEEFERQFSTFEGKNFSRAFRSSIYFHGNAEACDQGDRDSGTKAPFADNVLYLNNCINNSQNSYSDSLTNTWNSPEKLTYTYEGNTYTNYLGNYWDNYTGSDDDGDGIGDTAYSIGSNTDSYPLISLSDNYVGFELPPEWRRNLFPGDILYNPRALGSIGHTGIYIGDGWTADPKRVGCVHSLSTWDAKNEVHILRVDCPYSTREAAADWARVVANHEEYSYQYLYSPKNHDASSTKWYCSELVWAAYWNQGIDIEEFPAYRVPGEYNPWNPVSPDNICEDSDTYPVGGHCYGEPEVPLVGCCEPFCGCFIGPYCVGAPFILFCSADLEVTDPEGRVINAAINQISGAVYVKDDIDESGVKFDVIGIPEVMSGTYQVRVIPEPAADPDDTYTLVIRLPSTGEEVVLADHVPIHDIPEDPYEIQLACGEACHQVAPAAWHMLSIPGDLCGPCWDDYGYGNLCCAVCDDIDPCYIFRYDPDVGGYVMVPPCETIDYQAGMGFWVRTYTEPIEVCVDVSPITTTRCIPVGEGWNQIGNLFNFETSLSDVTVRYGENEVSLEQANANGWVSMYLFSYDTVSGGYEMVYPPDGGLQPWTGYWIRAYVDCEICIPSIEAPLASPSALVHPMDLDLKNIPTPPPPPCDPMEAIGEEVLTDLLVRNVPNPVRSEHTTIFKVEGKAASLVQAIRVEIYNQCGQKVFSQDINAKELDWHTVNDAGELLANGVYLYQVWVKIADTWHPTGIRKLAVYR